VKEDTGLPVLTDVHEVEQAALAAQVVDILQIPAFLCRQTDLIRAAGETGKIVNIKKGQWMTPEDMLGAVEKARGAGASGVTVTERGTFFGYGDLVVDMRSFQRIRTACDVPVIFDGTHSLQRPGRASGSSGGDPEFIPPLVRASVAAGCDGLFLEVHPDPRSAPSDSTTMLPLDQLKPLLESVMPIRAAVAGVGLTEADPGAPAPAG
jgi:2-dehydro-3-deoxyphosphooctonate aldolase (KDO 8-P synthase)